MAKNAPTIETLASVDAPETEGTIAERRQRVTVARAGFAAQVTAVQETLQAHQDRLTALADQETQASAAIRRAEEEEQQAGTAVAHARAALYTTLSDAAHEAAQDRLQRALERLERARGQVAQAQAHAAEIMAQGQSERVAVMAQIADATAEERELSAVLAELDARGADLTAEAGQHELDALREEVQRLVSRQRQAHEAEANATAALRQLKAAIRTRFAAHPGRVREAYGLFPADPDIVPAIQVLEHFDEVLRILDEGRIAVTSACYPGALNLTQLLELSRGQVEGLLRGESHCRQMFSVRRDDLRNAAVMWERDRRHREMGQG